MSGNSVLYDFLDDYLEDDDSSQVTLVEDQSGPKPEISASKLTGSTTTLIDTNLSVFQQSHQHNLAYLRNERRISSLQNISDPKVDRLLDDLNNLNFDFISKKHKRHVEKSNSKHILNFSKFEKKKSTKFGQKWHLAHQELIQGDWERIKFLARG